MSHSEFLKSLHEDDGRRWLIEERNGEACYIELAPESKNPYATGRVGATEKEKRERKRRSCLQRRSHNAKPYTWRLGYNTCTAQYTGDRDVPTLSGSSMNRKLQQNFVVLADHGGIMYKSKPAKKSDEPAVHVMSKRTKGKIRDKATAFFRAVKERKFVTLTFIEHVGDREGRKILNKFLTVARKDIPGFHNLTVSEHQPQRDTRTIHFHMLINRRLCIRRFNALWVLQQYNSGLTGHRASGEAISMAEIADRYNDGTIGEVLNPVQIEKAYSISGLAWYLTKYVTKQETGEKFGCLTWHCSRKVSNLFTSQVVGPSAFAFLQSFRNYKVDRSTGECWKPQQTDGAFYKVIYVNNRPSVLENLKMLEVVNGWIMDQRQTDRRWGDWKLKWGNYRRIYIGKDQNFDPAGIVGEILSHKKFLSNATAEKNEAGRKILCN